MRSLNRKGQAQQGGVNIFNIIFISIIFVCMMALGIGKMVNTMIGIGVSYGNVSGIEAFFLNNFVLWILFAFILWFMIAMSQT